MLKLRRLLLGAVAACSVALGCYSPNISKGGFSCGPGGACPDKFRCVEKNNRCYPSDVDASPDVPVDRPPVCTSVTSISTPICSTEPGTGQQCNPACQTGCGGCGWCAVVGGDSKCLTGTTGTKDVGDLCDPTSSTDCKAGLYCQPECSDTTGRCYKYCPDTTSTVCGAGSSCNVTLRKIGGGIPTGGFLLCSIDTSGCTVLPQSGCPTGFACYAVGYMQLECDCQGATATGDTCTGTPRCQPGNICIGPNSGATCHQVCNMSNGNADCPSGMTCTASGTPVGYCM